MLVLKKYPLLAVAGLVVILVSLAVRVYNIDYNSAFNDEAIYVVVGKMGLFEQDWKSYNASSWMGGAPFVYPNMAATAYTMGGLVGLRMLNVIFGVLSVEAIFVVTYLLMSGSEMENMGAGLVSAGLVGLSASGMLVSRLATYDLPSFYFFFLGLACLLMAEKSEENKARLYFLSSVTLILAVATKLIVGIYMPFVLIYSYLGVRGLKGKTHKLWRWYFLAPLVVVGVGYGLVNAQAMMTFYDNQVVTSRYSSYGDVWALFWKTSKDVWWWWLAGSVGMLVAKRWKQWLLLSLVAVWVLIVHLVSERTLTLDKHTFLAVGFASMVAGLGVVSMVVRLGRFKAGTLVSASLVVVMMGWYGVGSFSDAQKYNFRWENTDEVMKFLLRKSEVGDKVLTELGAVTNLALYEVVNPIEVITFDWIDYKGKSGEEGYRAAVRASHFDFLVLQSVDVNKSNLQREMREVVMESKGDNYRLAYVDERFEVYERKF